MPAVKILIHTISCKCNSFAPQKTKAARHQTVSTRCNTTLYNTSVIIASGSNIDFDENEPVVHTQWHVCVCVCSMHVCASSSTSLPNTLAARVCKTIKCVVPLMHMKIASMKVAFQAASKCLSKPNNIFWVMCAYRWCNFGVRFDVQLSSAHKASHGFPLSLPVRHSHSTQPCFLRSMKFDSSFSRCIRRKCIVPPQILLSVAVVVVVGFGFASIVSGFSLLFILGIFLLVLDAGKQNAIKCCNRAHT